MSTKIIAKSVLASAVGVLAVGQEAEAGPTESGFYGGLSFNNTDGRAWQYDFYDISGSGVGGFVGYNHVMGTTVLGFELSKPAGADAKPNGGDFTNYSNVKVLDLRGRIGTMVGNVHLYGSVGWSVGSYDDYYAGGSRSFSGLNYGFGAEMDVGQNAFVGLDVISRDIDDDWNSASDDYGADSSNLNTISLRVGFRF